MTPDFYIFLDKANTFFAAARLLLCHNNITQLLNAIIFQKILRLHRRCHFMVFQNGTFSVEDKILLAVGFKNLF